MDRPKVGLGVIVKKDNKVIVLQRQGAHGAFTWSVPGGHLEPGEDIIEGARREVLEEVNVTIKNAKVIGFTNDVSHEEKKHYITIWVESEYDQGEIINNEPEKAVSVNLVDWDEFPEPSFLPTRILKTGGAHPESAKTYHPFH